MADAQRREEYNVKAKALHEKYQSDFDSFMERRRQSTVLDNGVAEEQKIRQEYWKQMNELADEYHDVLKTAQ